MLIVVDEHTRECLAIVVARKLNSQDVIETLADLMLERGVPEHIRSDNGPEFTAKAVREWLGRLGATTLFIEPGSPWENGYCESFNGKLRYGLLDVEIFYTLKEAKILIENWRREYNTIRPHSSLGGQTPCARDNGLGAARSYATTCIGGSVTLAQKVDRSGGAGQDLFGKKETCPFN